MSQCSACESDQRLNNGSRAARANLPKRFRVFLNSINFEVELYVGRGVYRLICCGYSLCCVSRVDVQLCSCNPSSFHRVAHSSALSREIPIAPDNTTRESEVVRASTCRRAMSARPNLGLTIHFLCLAAALPAGRSRSLACHSAIRGTYTQCVCACRGEGLPAMALGQR